MTAIVEARALGKRFGQRWALRDCTLAIPSGNVVGLVGANGAGKTTLLNLSAGLLAPTSGMISVFGSGPAESTEQLERIGFVAQETPLYARLSVQAHVRMGAWLNPTWDEALAERRLARFDLDPQQRAGSLSAGQRAQLALTVAIAKRPELLLLDEPVASLDPLARHEFLQGVMEVVAEHEITVVLSSHLIADLERVCDYMIVLAAGNVQLAGEVGGLLSSHSRLSGPRRAANRLPSSQQIVEESHTDRQSTFLVRTNGSFVDPAWTVRPVTLNDLVLAYMRRGRQVAPNQPERLVALR